MATVHELSDAIVDATPEDDFVLARDPVATSLSAEAAEITAIDVTVISEVPSGTTSASRRSVLRLEMSAEDRRVASHAA